MGGWSGLEPSSGEKRRAPAWSAEPVAAGAGKQVSERVGAGLGWEVARFGGARARLDARRGTTLGSSRWGEKQQAGRQRRRSPGGVGAAQRAALSQSVPGGLGPVRRGQAAVWGSVSLLEKDNHRLPEVAAQRAPNQRRGCPDVMRPRKRLPRPPVR